jgi:RNA polymerase sigma-70 factor (ECF subfamily)
MEQEIRACLEQKRYSEAFDRLLPEFQNKVFRLAYAIVGDAALAEDMAQEAFIRIWKALPGYRGQSALSTWIYAITRNTCLTGLKKAGVKREHSLQEPEVARAAEVVSVPRPPHSEIDVLRFLDQLAERHQRVLRLYYMEGKSYEEVSRLLAWPMGTVKTCLHRARKVLAEAVAQVKMEKGPR